MKNIVFTSILCLTFSLAFSQAPDSTKNLYGTWKLNASSIESLAQVQLEQLKKANPAIADQINIETVREGLKAATYTYNADGTYLFKMSGQQDAGKWTLSDDRKSVVCKSDATGRESVRVIVKAAPKKISLKLSNGVTAGYEPVN